MNNQIYDQKCFNCDDFAFSLEKYAMTILNVLHFSPFFFKAIVPIIGGFTKNKIYLAVYIFPCHPKCVAFSSFLLNH